MDEYILRRMYETEISESYFFHLVSVTVLDSVGYG